MTARRMHAQFTAAQSATPGRAAETVLLAPLGIALRIEVERASDARVVRAACRDWQEAGERSSPGLRIALSVGFCLSGTGETEIRVADRTMRIDGSGVIGVAVADDRQAWCAVSPDYLASPARLREEVIEPLALFLLARNGRTPIHAAGFVAGEMAILATGPSGAGKSCLAAAADAAGWPVLSDDTVYLQSDPEPGIWGWPGAVHLLPRDCTDHMRPTRLRGGLVKHAVPLQAHARSARRAALCILASGPFAALEPLEPSEAMRRLGPLEPGFDLLEAEIAAAHRLLTENGAWLLTLSPRPAEAIALLAANLPRLQATAFP